MASLAGLLKDRGYRVTGSDQSIYPPMSTFLEKLGIEVMNGYGPQNLSPEPDMLVVGNVIPRGNPELEEALNRRLPYTSMPEVVKRLLLQGRKPIVAAGTHGKTTVTSMIAWLLAHAGKKPGFLIGGIARNFESSYEAGSPPYFVIEGDEYDTAYFDKRPKFHHYLPECLVVNHLEYDHADIYTSLESLLLEFRRLVNMVPAGGYLLVDAESANAADVARKALCRRATFGFDASADWSARDVVAEKGAVSFRIVHRGSEAGTFTLNLPGLFNVKNALAAAAAAHWAGLSFHDIKEGLSSFKGVMRRLELRGAPNQIEVYDDFAHHPTAIRAALEAIRPSSSSGRIFAVFEPRSWTARRNVHQARFPWAFEPADVTILAEVFQKEKIPEEIRLDPEAVAKDLQALGRKAFNIPDTQEIVDKLTSEARPGDIVIVMSNGGFDNIHEKIIHGLEANRNLGG